MNSSIIEQIQKGESKTLELKDSLPGGDAIAKTVVAFSNTSGGKLILWGSGLLRMRECCREAGIPEPSIRETGDFVEVEFIRPQTTQTDDYGQIPPDTVGKPSENRRIPSDCSEQERVVIEYLFEHQTIRSKQVEELLNIKESRARELLDNMVKKQYIIKYG